MARPTTRMNSGLVSDSSGMGDTAERVVTRFAVSKRGRRLTCPDARPCAWSGINSPEDPAIPEVCICRQGPARSVNNRRCGGKSSAGAVCDQHSVPAENTLCHHFELLVYLIRRGSEERCRTEAERRFIPLVTSAGRSNGSAPTVPAGRSNTFPLGRAHQHRHLPTQDAPARRDCVARTDTLSRC